MSSDLTFKAFTAPDTVGVQTDSKDEKKERKLPVEIQAPTEINKDSIDELEPILTQVSKGEVSIEKAKAELAKMMLSYAGHVVSMVNSSMYLY